MEKHKNNPLITKQMVPPSNPELEVIGALNPGAVRFGEETILLLRIAEACKKLPGKISVAMYQFQGNDAQLKIMHIDEDDPEVQKEDSRAIVYKGKEYVSTLSHLRLARSMDGVHFTIDEKPFLIPQHPSEAYGIEDARIVKIGGFYYINYSAVSGDSYGTSLVRTRDFKTVDYLGMIFCVPNKDVCIFPEKIANEFYALHRPYNHDFGPSAIWLARSPDLLHWGQHQCLVRPRNNKWESEKIGGGAPPVKTPWGWLEIYHGKALVNGKDFYSLMVLLLDLTDPTKIIYQGSNPIILPQKPYETDGFVPNVVFLNGMILQGETLFMYYAACDDVTCLAQCSLRELIPI